MDIAVLGLNHRTAPVELRERMAFPSERLGEALGRLRREAGLAEAVILSTCNRVELYAVLPYLNGHRAALMEFLSRWHALDAAAVAPQFYWHLAPESVRHLFRVAAGLDSMVLGESEILGQVKEASQRAVEAQTVGPVFRGLFQQAFAVAKVVRTTTQIGRGAVSVSSVAVDLARKIFADFSTKSILIFGAGQMGEATLRCLVGRGARRVLVANRSYAHAESLAEQVGGRPVPADDLQEALRAADILICSTAADHHLLTKTQMEQLMAQRRQRPVFLIDISVPRNLDPAIRTLANVYLYNIDDLEGIAAANLQRRAAELGPCLDVVERQARRFETRLVRLATSAPASQVLS